MRAERCTVIRPIFVDAAIDGCRVDIEGSSDLADGVSFLNELKSLDLPLALLS